MENMLYVWLGIIVFSVILEAATSELVSIWFVFGGLGGLVAVALKMPIGVQAAVAILISAGCLIFTRPFVKKKLNIKRVYTNADRYIGQKAIVIQEIDNIKGMGQVNVKGNIWTARSDDQSKIPVNTEVEILRIEGVKLIVQTLNISSI